MSFNSFLKIGITGGICSGKSFIADILAKMDYPIFYSDFEAKKIISENHDVKQQIIGLLGQEAFVDGEYNTVYVAKVIFNNEALRIQLNEIVHPVVRATFASWALKESERNTIVFNEAALLIETGSYKQLDYTILVSAPEELRLQRVMTRDGLTIAQAQARIEAQTSDAYKRQFVDFEIINDGRALLPQILTIIDSIRL